MRICTCCMSGCSVHTSPSIVGKFTSRQSKLVLNSKKNLTNCQTVKNAKNSNFSSSKCYGPKLLTRTKATGLPVTLYGTASRFEDRLDRRARRFLRMLVLFAVLLVDREEWFYFFESLSHVRRAIFCILFLFEENQVVDLVVVDHRPD